jgi:hypothetical protein
MRFCLRTLLIVLALGPPLIAAAWWYGKAAFVILVFALIVCPQLVLESAMLLFYTFGALPGGHDRKDLM